MICQPIIIDGPARGKHMNVEGYTFVVLKGPSRVQMLQFWQTSPDPTQLVPTFEQVTYHVHRFKIGDLSFAIATTKPQRPSEEKIIRKIFTASAIRAIIREN